MSLNKYADAPCNPVIVDPKHDPDGRYCVTCIRCGHEYDQWTDNYQTARQLADTHRSQRA